MQNQLKPCPVCGSTELGYGVSKGNPKKYMEATIWVQCSSCDARGASYPRNHTGKREAIQKWNDMPRTLKWQRTPPEEAGLYFYRNFFGCIQVVNVFAGMVHNCQREGEWAGPIPVPGK